MKSIILLLVIILMGVFVTGIVTAKSIDGNEEEDYIEVIVQNGDTLWNIAKPYYNGNTDFRNFIHDISDINNLEQGRIFPGQIILIPKSLL